ncbi:TPA: hypothetical protein SMP24_001077 [Proteus mirabilis]|nr:hypothetical protein [Proteus mirabilis]HEJ9591003.1 hypothetical protein [Proteus mirabilis]HEJ9674605.1 hypothetical protein [Proteus mirabilis]HEK0450304.1 hypothetical protein [Proteus mirabilis]HEK0558243.1 hypothetical protein [Proteus mirabilis]
MNEKDTEFHCQKSIKLTIDVDSDMIEMLNEWSRMVPTLYLLDICLVSIIKLPEESINRDKRKKKWIDELKNLDREKNKFSYICALMEKVSDSRVKMTDVELEEQILGDVASLRRFFKNASIYESDKFLISFLRELRGLPVETDKEKYVRFLKSANEKFNLKDAVSPSNRLNKAKELLEEADNIGIYKQHPVVVVTLACLYGNRQAKKLMKFKKNADLFDVENVLSDILIISRTAKLKLEIEHYGNNGRGRFPRAIFLSDDTALNEIRNCFEPRMVKNIDSEDGRETILTLTVNLEKLMTEITEDELAQLTELLK